MTAPAAKTTRNPHRVRKDKRYNLEEMQTRKLTQSLDLMPTFEFGVKAVCCEQLRCSGSFANVLEWMKLIGQGYCRLLSDDNLKND